MKSFPFKPLMSAMEIIFSTILARIQLPIEFGHVIENSGNVTLAQTYRTILRHFQSTCTKTRYLMRLFTKTLSREQIKTNTLPFISNYNTLLGLSPGMIYLLFEPLLLSMYSRLSHLSSLYSPCSSMPVVSRGLHLKVYQTVNVTICSKLKFGQLFFINNICSWLSEQAI